MEEGHVILGRVEHSLDFVQAMMELLGGIKHV